MEENKRTMTMTAEAYAEWAAKRAMKAFSLTPVQFYSKKDRPTIMARELVFRLLWNTVRANGRIEMAGIGKREASYPQLGRLLGGFHHATMILMEERICRRKENQGAFPLMATKQFVSETGGEDA